MTFEKDLKQVNCPRRLSCEGMLEKGRRAQNRPEFEVFRPFLYTEGLLRPADACTFGRAVVPDIVNRRRLPTELLGDVPFTRRENHGKGKVACEEAL